MRLSRLDLNLLVALDALLATRSVTAAARLLHVTQPTMSGSLARLREHFGDSLLRRSGKCSELTSLGESLAVSVRETLSSVEGTITMRHKFDPLHSKRHFKLCASESTVISLLARVLETAADEAPGVTFEIFPPESVASYVGLQRREIDFAFVVDQFSVSSLPQISVIDDEYCCVVWKGNKAVGKSITLEQYLTMGHVAVRYGQEQRKSFEQWSVEQSGLNRHEDVTCHAASLLGALIVGTDRIATMPLPLARMQCSAMPLRKVKLPFDMPTLRIVMQWHPSREQDAAMAWFRSIVLKAAATTMNAAEGSGENL